MKVFAVFREAGPEPALACTLARRPRGPADQAGRKTGLPDTVPPERLLRGDTN